MTVKQDQYYTIEEVAEILKVVYMTVYRWVKSGKLEAVKAGKQYRISNNALTKFIKIDIDAIKTDKIN